MDFNTPAKPEGEQPTAPNGLPPANLQKADVPERSEAPVGPTTVFTPSAPASPAASQLPLSPFSPSDSKPSTVFGAGPGMGGKKKFGGKKVLLAGIAAVLVLLGLGGYAFAFYLPSRPANVFKASLERTATGYDKLITLAGDEERIKAFSKAEISGDFKVEGGEFATDGTFSAKGDSKSGSASMDVGLGVTRLKGDVIYTDAASSESPDLYLRLSGIKGLGGLLGGDSTAFDSLDNQWIAIDHSLFDMIASSVEEDSDDGFKTPDSDTILEAAKTIGEVNRDYLLSANKDKAVLEMRSYVGSETVDGKKTKHFKVGINKAHYKTYVEKLGVELNKTKLGTWVKDAYGQPISELLDTEDLAKAADDIKDTDTFDMWVNDKTKLIHKIRVTDSSETKGFVEVGLNYSGGNEFPFFFTANNDGTELFKLDISLNTDTNVAKLGLTFDDGNGSTGEVNATVKPLEGSASAEAPKGAISLAEAMNRIGLGEYYQLLNNPSIYEESLNDVTGILPNEL